MLVACEFSGIVREAFRRRGHDAMSCDLLPTEIPGPHYQGDVFDVIEDGWDMMIAHPPCTFLSNAGAVHLYPGGVLNEKRLSKGLEAKEFFMALLNSQIARIAVENPIPSTVYGLPKYHQIIQPFEYGHPYQKKTCLWLKGLPKLIPTNIVAGRQSTKVPGNWYNKGGKIGRKIEQGHFPV